MKLIINTHTKVIKEKVHKSDSKKDTSKIETVLANQLAIAIAVRAHKIYKKPCVRRAYIKMIAQKAEVFLEKMEKETTPEERLLRNIFGEDELEDKRV